MKADIIRIGNSHGVRIPKPVLEQCGLHGEVEMIVEGESLIISPAKSVRHDWDAEFQKMAKNNDDAPLMPETNASDWDNEEWSW